jgi:predicted dehydrogenase
MSAASAPLRAALLGFGYAGRTFHVPLLSAVPGLHLALVASSQPGKVHAVLPDAEVIADSLSAATRADIDLVVIATPNATHAPLAEAALRAGKHVVVDKPFTLTLEEARALAALAESRQRILAVFQNRRWDSDFLAVKDVLSRGLLGTPLHFESHFDRFRPAIRQRWREQAVPGAGLWFDLGPHLADQALQLFGLPRTVSAQIIEQRPHAQAPDWAHVVLDYGPLRAILHASMLVAGGVSRFTIHGTAASWVKEHGDIQEAQLLAGVSPLAPEWGVDPEPAILHEGASGNRVGMATPHGDQCEFYIQLRDAILGRAASPVPAWQAVAVMAVIETAIESSAQGRALPLPLTAAERAPWEALS